MSLVERLRDTYSIRFASETERDATKRRMGMVLEAADRIEELEGIVRELLPWVDYDRLAFRHSDLLDRARDALGESDGN